MYITSDSRRRGHSRAELIYSIYIGVNVENATSTATTIPPPPSRARDSAIEKRQIAIKALSAAANSMEIPL